MFAASLAAAALIPLAIVRPVAKAQAAPAAPATVQLIGVRDVNVYHTDHRWWQADGLRLTGVEPQAWHAAGFLKDLFSSTNVKNLMFAFHLPSIHKGDTVKFDPTGSLVNFYQADTAQSLWTLESTFPLSQKTAAIQVGIAARPWSMAAAHAPVRRADAGVPSAYGAVVFSPIEHFQGNNWFMTVTINQPKQDQPGRDWRVAAVDAQGTKVPSGLHRQQRYAHPASGDGLLRQIRILPPHPAIPGRDSPICLDRVPQRSAAAEKVVPVMKKKT